MTNTDCRQTQLPVTALRSQVRLADAHTAAARAALPAAALIGLAEGDSPVALDRDGGNLLICAGSGGGTTTALRSLAAQAASLGAGVDVLDPAPGGHPWADGPASVTALHRIEEIHDRLCDRAAALSPRPDRASASGSWTGHTVIVVENAATLVFGLRQYWAHTRPETQLRDAPGVTALAQLLTAGPDYGTQVLAGNPRGDLPELTSRTRTAFTNRLVGSVGHAVWHRVAPEVWAIPAFSYHPGRLHLVADRTVTTVQGLFLDDAEAAALASTATGGPR
jgi:hypothetical protein